jgi:Alkylmercury lyase
MDQAEIDLRSATYSMFVELGRAPTVADVGNRLRLDRADVVAGWRRLHDEHALVLNQHTDEIRMANPFSAVPTAYRVSAGGRSWYANCAWDAVGICAALHVDGMIDSSCPDCGDAISLHVVDELPNDEALIFHCLVPASRWWDDIVFT